MEQDDVAKGQSGKQNVGMRTEGLEPSGPRAKRARVSMLRHTASSLELQADVDTDNEDEQPEQLDLQAMQVRSQTFADMEDADRLRHHAHTRDATATAKEIHDGDPRHPRRSDSGRRGPCWAKDLRGVLGMVLAHDAPHGALAGITQYIMA